MAGLMRLNRWRMPLWRRTTASQHLLAPAEVDTMQEACIAADHCDFLGRRARRVVRLQHRLALGLVCAAFAGLAAACVLYVIEQRLARAIDAEVRALERALGRLEPQLNQAVLLKRAIAMAGQHLRSSADQARKQARLSTALRALAEVESAAVSLTRIELSPQGLLLRGRVAGGTGLAQWRQALAERLPQTYLLITELKRNKPHAMGWAAQDRKVEENKIAGASAENEDGENSSDDNSEMNSEVVGKTVERAVEKAVVDADGRAIQRVNQGAIQSTELDASREAGKSWRHVMQGAALGTSMDFLAIAQPRVERRLVQQQEATTSPLGPAMISEMQQL